MLNKNNKYSLNQGNKYKQRQNKTWCYCKQELLGRREKWISKDVLHWQIYEKISKSVKNSLEVIIISRYCRTTASRFSTFPHEDTQQQYIGILAVSQALFAKSPKRCCTAKLTFTMKLEMSLHVAGLYSSGNDDILPPTSNFPAEMSRCPYTDS